MAIFYPIQYDDGVRRYNAQSVGPIAIFTFVLLTLEMGLRGDFDIDTIHYCWMFEASASDTINDILGRSRDFSYFIYSMLFAKITDSFVLFLLSLAAIEAFGFVHFIAKESKSFWLSLLILFCSGTFYTGFNIMRELIAASLVCNCYKFIYEKQFAKYVIFIIILSTIHMSALFMLPLYFITRIKWNGKSILTVVIIVSFLAIFLYQMADTIVSLTTLYAYNEYNDQWHFGMDEGISLAGTLKSVVLSGGVLMGYKYFNFKDSRDVLIFNGCILNIIIAVCGMKIFMIQRFTHYLIPFMVIGYPLILSRMKNHSQRQLWQTIIVLLFIASIMNTIINSNYYFFWDNIEYIWQ